MLNSKSLGKALISFSVLTTLYSHTVSASTPEDLRAERALKAQQAKEYGESLFQDSVVKNSIFHDLFEEYELNIGTLSGLLYQKKFCPENSKIQTAIDQKKETILANRKDLLGRYEKYCDLCTKENVIPFKPQDGKYANLFISDDMVLLNLDLKESTPSIKIFQLEPHERDLDKAFMVLQGSPLLPSIHPLKILDLNNQLVIEHMGPMTTGFQESGKEQDLEPKFLGMLKKNRIALGNFVDPAFLEIVLNILKPLSIDFSEMGPLQYDWQIQQMFLNINKKTFISIIGLIDKDKISFNVENYFLRELHTNRLINIPQPPDPVNGVNPAKEKCDIVVRETNKLFFVRERQYYNIEKDGEALSKDLAEYLNFSRKLYNHELKYWSNKGMILDGLIKSYEYALEQLSKDDGAQYMSVHTTHNSIGLVKALKKEFAVDRKELEQEIETHFSASKEEAQKYLQFKTQEKTLEKAKKWLDEIWSYVKKTGLLT